MTQVDLWEKPQSQKQMRDHQELFIEQVRAAAKHWKWRIVHRRRVPRAKTIHMFGKRVQ